MNTKQLAVLTALMGAGTAGSHAASPDWPVTGVAHPQFPDTVCQDTVIPITYIAEQVDPAVFERVKGAWYFSAGGGVKIQSLNVRSQYLAIGGGGTRLSGGSGPQIVKEINKHLFGTETPTPGAVSRQFNFQLTYALLGGERPGCLPRGARVCVGGTFLEPQEWSAVYYGTLTPVYPYDRTCSTIPEGGDYCLFDQPTASVDLGNVKSGGEAKGKTSVVLQCRGRGGDYVVSMPQGGGVIADTTGQYTLSINGNGLPAKVHGPGGTTNLAIEVSAKTTPGSSGPIRVSGTLILTAQ